LQVKRLNQGDGGRLAFTADNCGVGATSSSRPSPVFSKGRIEEALVRDSPADVNAQTTLALLYNQLGITHAKWAAKPDLPKAGSNEHWTKAKEAHTKSLAVYQKLKDNGKLSTADGRQAGRAHQRDSEVRRGTEREWLAGATVYAARLCDSGRRLE